MDQTNEITIISPSKGWVSLKLHELWEYRELLYFLVWRDVKVRYKQTVLGAAWAIIQPFFTMVVFSLFFGKLAKMPSDGIPYPLFSFAALKEYVQFLSIAKGSLEETKYLLLLSKDLGYIDENKYSDLTQNYDQVGKMLTGLIKSLRNRL